MSARKALTSSKTKTGGSLKRARDDDAILEERRRQARADTMLKIHLDMSNSLRFLTEAFAKHVRFTFPWLATSANLYL